MERVRVIQGDITKVHADAIVNAANSSLLGGGGVDGAIHRVGGPAILQECYAIRSRQGGCPTGEAVLTGAGNLPAKFVIHTVGPVWNGGAKQEDQLLASCYRRSLKLAVQHKVETIAFPSISTGIYHFPKERAARIAVQTIGSFLEHDQQLKEVLLVCFDEESRRICERFVENPTASEEN